MSSYGILITLSPKRLAQLAEDPETIEDVLDARHEQEIPGLLELGTLYEVLDALLSDRGRNPMLGDAVLARTGSSIGEGSPHVGHVLPPNRVAEVAKALRQLPAGHVRERATKAGATAADIAALDGMLAEITKLYETATQAKHAMMAIVVEDDGGADEDEEDDDE